MNKLYATIFTALVLAGTAQAQHPAKGAPAGLRSLHPTHSSANQDGARGGGTPVNDDCTGAVVQNVAAGATVSFSGDNTGATEDGGTGFVMVWEAFTTTECTDITINYCVDGSVFNNYLVNLAVGCPDFLTGVLTGASDGCSVSFDGLEAGTYYIPVMVDTVGTPDPTPDGPYTIEVITTACPPPPTPPANDDCANAIALTPGAACVTTGFNTTGATQTLPPIACDGFTSPNAFDAWFSFVATATEHTIGVLGWNNSDPMVELFEGTCAAPVSLQCEDLTYPMNDGDETAEQLVQTGLTVGNTYWVRVYDWGHFAASEHSFEICVTEGSGNTIGIEENDATTTWSIFPNPGAGTFTLQFSEVAGVGNVEVFDVTGRAVYSERTSLGAFHTLDLSGVAPGNYTVRVTLNDERTEQKLVVQ